TVAWEAPADDGRGAITGYRIQASTDATSWTTIVDDSGSDATERLVEGVSAGVPVSFRVAAINTAGVSPYSQPSAPVVPTAPAPGGSGGGGAPGQLAGVVTVDPVRLADTREAGVPVAAGGVLRVRVAGRGP